MASVDIPASLTSHSLQSYCTQLLLTIRSNYINQSIGFVMGLCWSTNLPEEEAKEDKNKVPHLSHKDVKISHKRVEFGREETKLDDLLASLRTGLVIAPTEFDSLPSGISTTAKTRFTVGNSKLQHQQEESVKKSEKSSELNESEDNKLKEKEEEEEVPEKKEASKVVVGLKGHGWVKGLTMGLSVLPVIGPYAGKQLSFRWQDDVLEVVGSRRCQLSVQSLPLSFESEAEFCKCCLLLAYLENSTSEADEQFDLDADEETVDDSDLQEVPRLTYSAYKVVIANLDSIYSDSFSTKIPAKLYHILFGSQDPVVISIAIWPKSNTQDNNTTMKVKSDILFTELSCLVKEHFGFKTKQHIKLYDNFKPVNLGAVVSAKCNVLNCFVVPTQDGNTSTTGSYNSLAEEDSFNSEVNLVVSLVGESFEELVADLQMLMMELDAVVRERFNLKKESFLIILAEDDLAPQYTADDDWKCTYSFSVHDNSFSAGLRRSFRRLRRGDTRAESQHAVTTTAEHNSFVPHMAEVILLLSSNERQFPKKGSKSWQSVAELYNSWPIYKIPAEQCGIHPYSIIQVFEVTGPSIPITVRVLFDYDSKAGSTTTTSKHAHSSRTRLANIMDINPEWSISTFMQYIDAVISLSSTLLQRRLWLKENLICSEEDELTKLKLGELLDFWKPTWWAEEGCSRRQLTVKDIDPSEYLVVEKF